MELNKNIFYPIYFEALKLYLKMFRFKPITLLATINTHGGMIPHPQINPFLPNQATIMGRNTWDNIDTSKLNGEFNIICSKNLSSNIYGSHYIASSLNQALSYCSNEKRIENIVIAGGPQLYQECFNRNFADRAMIYRFQNNFESDTFFPISWLHSKPGIIKKINHKEMYNFFHLNPNESAYLRLLQSLINLEPRLYQNQEIHATSSKLQLNLLSQFPLLTTKYINWNLIVEKVLSLPNDKFPEIKLDIENDFLDGSIKLSLIDCYNDLPNEIAFYSLLLEILAHKKQLKARKLTLEMEELYIYCNDLPKIRKQLCLLPLSSPRLDITSNSTIHKIKIEDCRIENYRFY